VGVTRQLKGMSDMELYRRLGRAVAKRRDFVGMTQAEVAAKLGLTRASLANLENGRQRIMVHQLFALVQALRMDTVLDLVPETWPPREPLPEFDVAGGATLRPEQQFAVEKMLSSAFVEKPHKKPRS
jgi:transcriptional regulator with XRE-family HTH domain